MTEPLIALLVRQLHQSFDSASWHGTNLMGSLRGLDRTTLTWRPQPERHNIAELAVHAAYWKYRACRLLDETAPRKFDLPGSDFFARDRYASDAEWAADVELLRDWHRRLTGAVETFDPSRLGERTSGDRFTFAELIGGVAVHDIYHAGQIQLIRRLYESA
jgi:uncharacterized damage-inducible protein DinB